MLGQPSDIFPEFLWAGTMTRGTIAGDIGEFLHLCRSPARDHPSVLGVLNVGGRVEEITSEEDREAEGDWVPRPEEMHGPIRPEALLAGDDDVYQVCESIGLHKRYHTADSVYPHGQFRQAPGTILPEVHV